MENWKSHLEKWIIKGKIAERKGNSVSKESILAKDGLRYVTFAWPAEQWEIFVNKICQNNKPNDVVWAIIAKKMIDK